MLQLNPIIGFFDPLNLAEGEFWQQSQESTIGFLREVRWCARLYVRGVRVRGCVPVLCVCCVCGVRAPHDDTLSPKSPFAYVRSRVLCVRVDTLSSFLHSPTYVGYAPAE